MSPTLLYRIAAALLLLFAAGHTLGFLAFKPPSPEGLAVRGLRAHGHCLPIVFSVSRLAPWLVGKY